MPSNFAQDYIEVADRIAEWYVRYPDGSILTEIVQNTAERVTVRAEVYRDGVMQVGEVRVQASGVGHSSMAIPGSTPFTRGAELENAETSAVGRALVMAGIPSKNVASANEVRATKSGGASREGTATTAPNAKRRTPQEPSTPGPTVPADDAETPADLSSPADARSQDPDALPASGEPGAGGDPFHVDVADLWVKASNLGGGSADKVVSWMQRKHPDWEIRTDADVLGWHLIALIEEVTGAKVDA